jgi:GT2 family glycosyltransferase
MDSHPQAGAAGPQLLNSDGTLQQSCSPMPTPLRECWRLAFLDYVWRRATYPLHRWSKSVEHRVEVIKGATLLIRREALDQVGLLDEAFFIYSEEVDLCMRLGKAGWEVWWVPYAKVIHHEAGCTSQVADSMLVELYRSKILFCRKHYGGQAAQRFKVCLSFLHLPRFLVATAASVVRPSQASRADRYRRLLAELRLM